MDDSTVGTETASTGLSPATAATDITEDHAELDILDSLGLEDTVRHAPLKQLFLDTSGDVDENVKDLTDLLKGRLEEGNGETLFEIGYENNGDAMDLSKAEWDISFKRLQEAASILNSDCRLLITRNVGGEEEAPARDDKEKGSIGKIMIRRKPFTSEDVIETRIAVVGNGTSKGSGSWCSAVYAKRVDSGCW